MFQIPKGNQARDALSAIVILVICAVGIGKTLEYPARAAEWPLWMWSLLALLSVVLLFNSLRAPIGASSTVEKEPSEIAKVKRIRIAINIAMVMGFVSLVSILGFYTAGIIYLCIHMYYLGIRPILRIVAVAVGTLIVFYGVFEYFLGVLVPHGMIF